MKNLIVKRGDEFWPTKELKKITYPNSESIYKEADNDPLAFWEDLARQGIDWFKEWKTPYKEKLPKIQWFPGAKVNACYNAVDRHVEQGLGKKTAIIWVPEPVNEKPKEITYKQLYDQVSKCANALKKLGVKKGDVVGVYLPMIPEVVISILACARIGAVHSVVFSAFSAEALKARLIDGESNVLITSDGYYRKGRKEDLFKKAEEGIKGTNVKKVLVVSRTKTKIPKKRNYYSWSDMMKKADKDCPPRVMDANDYLFMLYTSGTTGKPKGVIHDTAGYITQAYWTTRWNFSINDDSVMWCTADIGWVTGHTYMCYGPLLNGITTLLYEGLVNYPTPSRIWDIVDEHKVNALYTAPTAIRVFMSQGNKWLKNKKLTSLTVIGTVGEPIDNKTWLWYFEKIGKKRCPVIDTYWQTETGGNIINALPGVGPFKPSFASHSFPGTTHVILGEDGKKVRKGKRGYLMQQSPFFPGMMVGVWKAPKRFKKYWRDNKYYITGDRAIETKDGFRILGRADDVLKVAGHRISTAEIENAIYKHPLVGECAISSKADEIRGEVPIAFVKLKKSVENEEKIKSELIEKVIKYLGPTSKPKQI